MKLLWSLFILLFFVQADAKNNFFPFGSKKWWYRSGTCDSLYQKKSPGDGWSSERSFPAEVCNGMDDNCNGIADDGITTTVYYADADGDGYGNAFATVARCDVPAGYVTNSFDCDDADARIHLPVRYYVDANGDGYGDAAGDTLLSCTLMPPAGASTMLAPAADISLSPIGRKLNGKLWIFNTENLFYDKRYKYDPLTAPLLDKIRALQPKGFMYSGSPSHYHQFFAGDTLVYAPTGYNAIPNRNEMADTSLRWNQSHFASTVELARQCGAGLLLQSSPTKNCDQFLSIVNWMEQRRGVPLLGLLVDLEYSDANWNSCTNCGDGDAVAADGTYWFGCLGARNLPRIIDNSFNPLLPGRPGNYSDKIENGTLGFNAQRFYYSPSKGTYNLSATMPVSQIVDSFDYGIDVMLPQISQLCSRASFCASLYPEDIDPRGGRLKTSGTWANCYFIASGYIAQCYLPEDSGCVFGRFDLLWSRSVKNGVTTVTTNSLFDAMTLIGKFFNYPGELHRVTVAGVRAVATVDANHHGYILAATRSGISHQVASVSVNGYYAPVISIEAQVATSLSDAAPVIRSSNGIEGYSITLIQF